MRHVKLGFCISMLSLGVAACGVDPADGPAEATDSAQLQQLPLQQDKELAPQQLPLPEHQLQTAQLEGAVTTALLGDAANGAETDGYGTCRLEENKPCSYGYDDKVTCKVECCDGAKFNSKQACSKCADWAAGACAYHNTRKRITWDALY
jgi:hypothetical protein